MHSHENTSNPHVIIIGAGLAGCLSALLLAKHGCSIDIYEYRSDMRKPDALPAAHQRSINLALSTRGITALRQAGIADPIIELGIPMHGRCVHHVNANSSSIEFQPYGQKDQFLLSVSRIKLNQALLDACDKFPSINIHFNTKCIDINLRAPSVTLQSITAEQIVATADLVIGADGSYSKVRSAMQREDRFNYSQSYVSAAYKELSMVRSSVQGVKEEAMPVEWLHIWPRHRFMLIALPNNHHSFTCTLFMDKQEIDSLATEQQIESFFKTNFPDAVQLMPSLISDFKTNPTTSLLTVRCNPYHFEGKALLIGDAAHAIVPFYGQGCNAAFEDCRLLADAIYTYGLNNIRQAVISYADRRIENARTIADLALDHYEDMSSRAAKPFFVMRRRLEILANRFFPESFLPLYSMISFSNIPYAEAVRRAEQQDKIIEKSLQVFGTISVVALAGTAIAWRRQLFHAASE